MPGLSPPVQSAVYVHAAFGFVALASGAVAIAAKKGRPLHRRAGQVFVGVMLAGLLLAQPAIFARSNHFLGSVGLFTTYMVLRGFRLARRRQAAVGAAAGGFDRLLAGTAAVAGAVLVASGVVALVRGASLAGFATVQLGLGAVSLRLGSRDLLSMRRDAPPPPKDAWIVQHLVAMLGAYTAAVVAFSSVNFRPYRLPPALVWLTPLAIGILTITLWVRKIRARPGAGPERS